MSYASLNELVAAARLDRLVGFPTDTVPALATLPAAADLVFAAKQRGADKPLILMGASALDLWAYVDWAGQSPLVRRLWQDLADRFWPGALTLVLPVGDRCPPAMNRQDPTMLGLRVPNHPIAREILAKTGPLATTSANLSGQAALLTAVAIAQQFPAAVVLEPPWDPLGSGLPSTVVKWTEAGWVVLRQGAVLFP
jgi:L-threonylcarbamoyladenylate synthase